MFGPQSLARRERSGSSRRTAYRGPPALPGGRRRTEGNRGPRRTATAEESSEMAGTDLHQLQLTTCFALSRRRHQHKFWQPIAPRTASSASASTPRETMIVAAERGKVAPSGSSRSSAYLSSEKSLVAARPAVFAGRDHSPRADRVAAARRTLSAPIPLESAPVQDTNQPHSRGFGAQASPRRTGRGGQHRGAPWPAEERKPLE